MFRDVSGKCEKFAFNKFAHIKKLFRAFDNIRINHKISMSFSGELVLEKIWMHLFQNETQQYTLAGRA